MLDGNVRIRPREPAMRVIQRAIPEDDRPDPKVELSCLNGSYKEQDLRFAHQRAERSERRCVTSSETRRLPHVERYLITAPRKRVETALNGESLACVFEASETFPINDNEFQSRVNTEASLSQRSPPCHRKFLAREAGLERTKEYVYYVIHAAGTDGRVDCLWCAASSSGTVRSNGS